MKFNNYNKNNGEQSHDNKEPHFYNLILHYGISADLFIWDPLYLKKWIILTNVFCNESIHMWKTLNIHTSTYISVSSNKDD